MISESDNRHLVQIKQLIWFYGVSTVVDWIIIVGQRQCLRNGDIICVNNRFLEVKNNLGALLALSFDMSSFAYAFVMWYIFFYTPNRFGKLTNLHGVSVIMDDQLRKSMTLERQEEQVKTLLREFEHDRQFTKTQINRQSNIASALESQQKNENEIIN